MPGKLLLSTAYLPPSEYFSLIKSADEIWIEQHENYLKQTYRNRCKILSSNGITILSVPVSKGHNLKALIRDITIDYSKRWQQVHLRAVTSAYSRSPFFQFFFEHFEKIITANHKFLIDLNNELLKYCLLHTLIHLNLQMVKVMISDTGYLPKLDQSIVNGLTYRYSQMVLSNKAFQSSILSSIQGLMLRTICNFFNQ